MHVFRIHIRPQGGSADMETTFNYCLKNRILGVGWRTDSNQNTTNWEEYYGEASKKYKKEPQSCKYINERVGEGDLVWTRDAGGQYYLAKVTAGWEYWVSKEANEQNIDIANIFRVEFQNVSIDSVPGKVVASFRASRSIQKIADTKALDYSKYLWNQLSNENTYHIDKSKFSDVFMMLDDEETEDLVFLYLQTIGWYVVPNSRKGDTMSFEYLAVNPKTGEKALSQVKTGNASINKDDYVKYGQKIFLFQSSELYSGTGNSNIECLSRDNLPKFLSNSLSWLPTIFQKKVNLVSSE